MTKAFNTGFALKIAPWLALLLSAGLWGGALAFEHFGGFKPCQMCYWQRHAHKVVLVIAIAALITRYISKDGTWDRVFMVFIGIALAVSFGLAFWHTGVEYKWWEGPKTCSAGAIGSINAQSIADVFKPGAKILSCEDAPWHMFNISMAGYNAFFSAIGSLLGFHIAFKSNSYD